MDTSLDGFALVQTIALNTGCPEADIYFQQATVSIPACRLNGIFKDKKYIKPYAEKIMIVEPGRFEILVGASSEDIRLKTDINILLLPDKKGT